MLDLTVITTTYNSANYIERCLDSLHYQNIKNAEFLIIDDGSTDNTIAVIKNYFKKIIDNRFKLLQKPHREVSATINYGLSHVNSKYVTFIDSDDYLIYRQSLDKLVNEAVNYQLDILEYNYQTITTESKQIAFTKRYAHQVINGENLLTQSIINNDFHSYLWHYLFNTDFINNNNLRLDQNVNNTADLLFMINALIKAKRTMYDNLVVYNYLIREQSFSRNVKKIKTNYHDYLYVLCHLNNLLKFIKNKQCLNKMQAYLAKTYLTTILKADALNLFKINKNTINNFLGNKPLSKRDKLLKTILSIPFNDLRHLLCLQIYHIYYRYH